MQGKRSLVRNDAGPLGPQPCRDQILVLPSRKMHEPVHTAPNFHQASTVDMVNEELWRIANVGCLLRREHAFLRSGSLVEAIPVRVVGTEYGGVHAQNVSLTLVLCNVFQLRLDDCHSKGSEQATKLLLVGNALRYQL
jgi:hypothetical protein